METNENTLLEMQQQMKQLREMLDNQRTLLERFGTTFDCWFSERNLYVEDESGLSAVDRALAVMRRQPFSGMRISGPRRTSFPSGTDNTATQASAGLRTLKFSGAMLHGMTMSV